MKFMKQKYEKGNLKASEIFWMNGTCFSELHEIKYRYYAFYQLITQSQ